MLWIARSLLALLLVAGGAYKLFQPADLAAQFAYVPLGVWRALGALEIIGGLLLVLPLAVGWKPHLAPIAAVVLLVEALGLSVLYARQSTALTAANPLIWSVFMALLLAFVAFAGRAPSSATA
jgi:hypothetical protein